MTMRVSDYQNDLGVKGQGKIYEEKKNSFMAGKAISSYNFLWRVFPKVKG